MPSRIDCEEALARLMDFLNGELDEAGRHRMQQHLDTCRGCFSRAEFERRLRERIAETGSRPAPASLRRRIDGLMDTF